jgi:nucleoside-diphosphate-sugar epimerase
LDDYNSLNKLLNSNIQFFCRLLDALKETNLKLFINTGTFAEYYKGDDTFDPAYLYAATKTASRFFLDYYSKVYNFKQATVVPYTIYGGNDTQKKVIDIIYDSIDSETPVDMSPGEQVLDFIHIDDVVNFYLTLLDKINDLPEKSNFKLGTGIGHTLKDVASIIESITGKKTNINWGGKEYRKSDVMYAVADKPETILWNYKIGIEQGIEQFLESKK